MIFRQKISNFPLDESIERYVVISRFNFDSIYKTITIDAKFQYMKDGVDVSSYYKTNIANWVISNFYSISVENPEYWQVDTNGDFILDTNGDKVPVEKTPVFDEIDGEMVPRMEQELDEEGNPIMEDVVVGQDDNNEDIIVQQPKMVQVLEGPSEYLEIPAYDYFMGLIMGGDIPLSDLVTMYILSDDSKGAFDRM